MATGHEEIRKSNSFDWSALQDAWTEIETNASSLVSENHKSYVRVHRFIRKLHTWNNHDISFTRNSIVSIAIEFGLNPRQAARVLISLADLKNRFEIGLSWDNAPSHKSILKELEKIELSVKRIANFLAQMARNESMWRIT